MRVPFNSHKYIKLFF